MYLDPDCGGMLALGIILGFFLCRFADLVIFPAWNKLVNKIKGKSDE